MSDVRSEEEIAKWHRYFAVECNNRAWSLCEQPSRDPAEDEEMIAASYAAAFHWRKVGTDRNSARADLLMAQAHALLGHADPAREFAARSFRFVRENESPDWEVALTHAVMAHAAAVGNDVATHSKHYAQAQSLVDALSDGDKQVFMATFRTVPPP